MSQFLANIRDQRKQDDRVRQFTVDDVLKHPTGNYTVYKISLLESPIDPSLPPVERTVWKRYRDIRKLYENLVQLHASLFLSGKVPDFPKAKLFGRFEESTVEERRVATEKLLQFIAQFPIVCRNPLVQSFFSRSEFPPAASAPVEEDHSRKPSAEVACPDLADSAALNDNLASSSLNNESDDSEELGSSTAALARNINPWWVTNDEAPTTGAVPPISVCDSVETKTAEEVVAGESTVVDAGAETDRENTQEHLSSSNHVMPAQKKPYTNGVSSVSSFAMPITNSARNTAGTHTTHANDVELNHSSVNADILKPTRNGTATNSVAASAAPVTSPPVKPTEFGDYLAVASHQLALAAQRESQGEYAVAFDLYSLAVDILLRGVQTDTDQRRRDAVRRKTAKYLKKAESIYSTYIVNNPPATDTSAVISVAAAGAVDSNSPQQTSSAKLKGTEKDLHRYKVVGSLAESVLLVLSSPSSSPTTYTDAAQRYAGETLCMKVLRKAAVFESPSKTNSRFRTIVPTTLPFMVPLVQFIETPDAIYIVTAWAKGGKLFDYIENCCKSPYEQQTAASADEFDNMPSSVSRRPDYKSSSTVQNSILAFVRRYGGNKTASSDADDENEVVTQSVTLDYRIPPATASCNDPVMPSAANSGEREVISITVGQTQTVPDRVSDDDDADSTSLSAAAVPQTLSSEAAEFSRRSAMTRSTSETFGNDNNNQKSARPEFLTTKSMLFNDGRLSSPHNGRRVQSNEKSSPTDAEHAHITVQRYALDSSGLFASRDLRRKNSNKLKEKISISDALYHRPTAKSSNSSVVVVAKDECLIKKFMHADHFSGDARAEECQAMTPNGIEDSNAMRSKFFVHEDDTDDDDAVKPTQRPAALRSSNSSAKEQERLEICTIKKTVRRGSIQSTTSKNMETHEKLINAENNADEPIVTKNDGFATLLLHYSAGRNVENHSGEQQQTSSLAAFLPTSPVADGNMVEFELNNWEAAAPAPAPAPAGFTPDAVESKRQSSNYDLLTQELNFDPLNNVVENNNVSGGRRSSQSVDDAGHDSGWWPSTSSIEYQQQYEAKLDPFGVNGNSNNTAVLNRSVPSLNHQQPLTLVWPHNALNKVDGESSSSRARHVSADVAAVGGKTAAQQQQQRNSMTSTTSSDNSAATAETLDALGLVARARELMSRVDERLNSGHKNAGDDASENGGAATENAAAATGAFAAETNRLTEVVAKRDVSFDHHRTLDLFTSNIVKQRKVVSERMICQWLAELTIVVDALHQTGIFVGDLNPDNVLLGTGGNICLTYISQWRTAPRKLNRLAVQRLYAAPELRCHDAEVRAACDVWSIGAIAFELFTRTPLYLHHNNGAVEVLDKYHNSISPSATLCSASCLPTAFLDGNGGVLAELISAEARDLLSRLLKFKPEERLSLAKMREHPFFRTVNWGKLETVGMSLSNQS